MKTWFCLIYLLVTVKIKKQYFPVPSSDLSIKRHCFGDFKELRRCGQIRSTIISERNDHCVLSIHSLLRI